MKDVGNTVITIEESSVKKATDLYKIWWTGGSWTYTSYDEPVSYGGLVYKPAAIERGSVSYDSKLEVSTLSINIVRMADPAIKFIAMNPVEALWIQVLRAFPDTSPLYTTVVFIGQIKNVVFKGVSAQVECVGFEFALKQPIPVERYAPQCNWTVFDDRCAKSSSGFVVSLRLNSSPSLLIWTSPLLSAYGDGYFTFGFLIWESNRRMITGHSGDTIQLRYPIFEMEDDALVSLYAGCDGSIQTCKDKFNNVVNFGGFPYVPRDNPVTWE